MESSSKKVRGCGMHQKIDFHPFLSTVILPIALLLLLGYISNLLIVGHRS